MTAKVADPEFTKGCEVFVLPNLYGDIVTDAAAEMPGGLRQRFFLQHRQ